MLIDDFNNTIDVWIKELEGYTFAQLSMKPSPTSWSLGQVYAHLVENTRYFIDQVKICITTNDNTYGEAAAAGKNMLHNNQFPDELLEGPPENLVTPQPESKEQILDSLISIKDEMNAVTRLIYGSPFKGKTKHPGLGYFSAQEWLQFTDMHLRHHFRQKKRIDQFLNQKPGNQSKYLLKNTGIKK